VSYDGAADGLVHPAARSLAMSEAVTGPLYLAILVARLVSLSLPVAGERR
jgi:hypothetical protein